MYRKNSGQPRPHHLQPEGHAGLLGEASRDVVSEEMAATGIGRRIGHDVRRVHFQAERNPAAVLQLRYEYRDALVRLGVLPSLDEPLARRERADGFDDTGFAPDPYRP